MRKPDIKIVEVIAVIIGDLSLIFMDKPTPVLIGKITVTGGILFALWLILPFKALKNALASCCAETPEAYCLTVRWSGDNGCADDCRIRRVSESGCGAGS